MLTTVTMMTMAQSSGKPYTSPAATRYTVEGTAKMESGRLMLWNPVLHRAGRP
jgi:hypothetical protein